MNISFKQFSCFKLTLWFLFAMAANSEMIQQERFFTLGQANRCQALRVLGASLLNIKKKIQCSSLCLDNSTCSGFCYNPVQMSCDLYEYSLGWYDFYINTTLYQEVTFDYAKTLCNDYEDMLFTPQIESDPFFSWSKNVYWNSMYYLGYQANAGGSYTNIYTGSTLDLWSWNNWDSEKVNRSFMPITRGMSCVYLEKGLLYDSNCSSGIIQAHCFSKPCSWVPRAPGICYVKEKYFGFEMLSTRLF